MTERIAVRAEPADAGRNEVMRDTSDLTIRQAAEELRVFPEQIEGWVERGTLLNAYALNEIRGIRIPRADVEALKQDGYPEQPSESVEPGREGEHPTPSHVSCVTGADSRSGRHQERLSTSTELTVSILDLLSGNAESVALLAGNERVVGKCASRIPLNARPSASRVEHAKAVYVAQMGTTRL